MFCIILFIKLLYNNTKYKYKYITNVLSKLQNRKEFQLNI